MLDSDTGERVTTVLDFPSRDGLADAPRTAIAGVAIPDSALAHEATEFVQDASTQLLFDHSRRVFSMASMRAEQLSLGYDAELLYVGAMFHDVGLLAGHRSADERFEIDGANAARAFLERHGLPEERVMTVWESIALHTTRQVPKYKQPEVRLVALGVEYDLFGSPFDALSAEQRDAVLAAHPRTKFKTGMPLGNRGRQRSRRLACCLLVASRRRSRRPSRTRKTSRRRSQASLKWT